MKLTLLFLSGLLLLAPLSRAQSTAPTSMDEIAAQQSLPCSSELRQLAQATLKHNPHRMLAYNKNGKDIHLFNALAVTSYRDRDSHVTFHGVKNINGSCDTSVTESYVLQTTCGDARNEAFSKWDYQGQLNDHTMVLKSQGVKGKQAFLTTQFHTLCLITTRQVIYNPALK
ncbi:MAG: hypothetical protein OQK77_07065 [Psychromonas sp.]|nr:hypothetical protein [Psychromonas sp.]